MSNADDHAKFLAEYAAEIGYLFGEVAPEDIDRVSRFIEWFAEKTIEHGYGHGVEDTKKRHQDDKTTPAVDERGKVYTHVPRQGWASTTEEIRGFVEERKAPCEEGKF
jgi:hypothetical protein